MEKLICPKCEGNDVKKGTIGSSFGQVQMFPKNKRGKSSSISAEYCNDCGYILSFFVDHPNDVD